MRSLILSSLAVISTVIPIANAQLLEPQVLESKKAPASLYDSVVRIEVSTQVPDYRSPWKSGSFTGGTGTGFLIGENLFMTNAHVVSNQRQVLVTKHGSAKKYEAKVIHVAHDCDLALLKLEDFSAFEGLQKFKFTGVPKLESTVRVIGYPVGGDRISITRGVVSRIDFRTYSHSRIDAHLVVQIDAAINPGNSGGPVLQGDNVVGVAFQGLRQADNTGYMIPTPVVKRFLKDVEDGVYDKYVELGFITFNLHNPAMRKVLGLKAQEPGVLVSSVIPGASSDGIVKKGDVIVSLDGHAVDASGNVVIHEERVDMNEVAERKFVGDKVKLGILRDGKTTEVEVTLKKFDFASLYVYNYDKKPRYTMRGGLLFQPLTGDLYGAHRLDNPKIRKIANDYVSKELFKELKDVVILTRVLKDQINSNISGYTGLVVESINGEKVTSLNQAHELLNPEKNPEFFVISCAGVSRPLVLRGDLIGEADTRIQQQYGVSKMFNLNEK